MLRSLVDVRCIVLANGPWFLDGDAFVIVGLSKVMFDFLGLVSRPGMLVNIVS